MQVEAEQANNRSRSLNAQSNPLLFDNKSCDSCCVFSLSQTRILLRYEKGKYVFISQKDEGARMAGIEGGGSWILY